MKPFDTHAHLYDDAFAEDVEEVVNKLEQKLSYVVIPAEDVETSKKAVELANTHSFLYAAVGIHPHRTKAAKEKDLETLQELAQNNPKVKAFGEMGLDYFYFHSDKETQQKWFALQIEAAKEMDLPIIIHDRDAHQDTLDILKAHKDGKLRGIIHCFSGSYEVAKEMIKLGFYISFAGPVVFPNSTKLKKVAQLLPLERMLIETDSPYLTPPPNRGKRNDPSNVWYVAEEIARLKSISVEKVIEATTQNGMDIYGITNS